LKDELKVKYQHPTTEQIEVNEDTTPVDSIETTPGWDGAYVLASDFGLPRGVVLGFSTEEWEENYPVFIKIKTPSGKIEFIQCDFKIWSVLNEGYVLK